MKLILINAPPYAGKDTAALTLKRYHNITWHVGIERMSMPIKRAFAGMMNLPIDNLGNVFPWERYKEKPLDVLPTTSYRGWQILFSEHFMKHQFGNDVFARLLWHRIEQHLNKSKYLIIVPDCGFQTELDYLLDGTLHSDIMVIQVERPGCTFEHDSREWVKVPDTITHLRILNDGTKEDFEDLVIRTTKDWILRT